MKSDLDLGITLAFLRTRNIPRDPPTQPPEATWKQLKKLMNEVHLSGVQWKGAAPEPPLAAARRSSSQDTLADPLYTALSK